MVAPRTHLVVLSTRRVGAMHGDLSSSGANRTYGGGWTAMEADFGLHYALIQPTHITVII